MESSFDFNQFLKDIAEEQLFESISPQHLSKKITRQQQLLGYSSNYSPEFKEIEPGKFERLNPIVPEFIEELRPQDPRPGERGYGPVTPVEPNTETHRRAKKPVDEKGYPFVSQSDAARILEIDRKAEIFSGSGTIRIEREKIPGSTKSPRVWIRLIDLKSHLESRDPIKAAKIGECLTQIEEFRALASQNGFKLRFLGSDYDRPDFYSNLIK
jgi:hypothetical protein